jgi:hypothetical protein
MTEEEKKRARTDVAIGHLGFGCEAGIVSEPGDGGSDEGEEDILDHHPLFAVSIHSARGRRALLLVVVDAVVSLVVVASLVRVFVSVGHEGQTALVGFGSW